MYWKKGFQNIWNKNTPELGYSIVQTSEKTMYYVHATLALQKLVLRFDVRDPKKDSTNENGDMLQRTCNTFLIARKVRMLAPHRTIPNVFVLKHSAHKVIMKHYYL